MTDFITLKPKDVDRSTRFCGSLWQKSEKETIASNIVFIMGDDWKPFSWEDYTKGVTHNATNSELNILDEFVEDGYLDKRWVNLYIVTDKFKWVLFPFVKK